jgi:hypothetical protein
MSDLDTDDDLHTAFLSPSFEAFGLILDYLSLTTPFSGFELGNIAEVVRGQLGKRNHLVAMIGDRLVGYAGWMHTTIAIAEEWTSMNGILRPVSGAHDAAALTIFAVTDTRATPRLIRGARDLNKDVRVFFKRGYQGEARGPKKASVLNYSTPSNTD